MERQNNRNIAILSLIISWMFYLYSYIARVEPSVLVNDLMDTFGVTSSVIGVVISVTYIPYVIMQIPCGIITDKLGITNMIFSSSLLCALGAFVFGAAHSVFQLEIGRFLIGLGSASAYLCCGKVASEFFDKSKYALLMGLAMCMGCFGGISGTAPTAYLVEKLGWRNTTYIIAAIGAILALLALLCMRSQKVKSEENKSHKGEILKGLMILAKNYKTWLLGFYGGMAYLPLSAMAELWCVPFMEQRFNFSTETASFSSIVIFVGFGLGGIISAWVAERINSYKNTIIFFTIGMIIAFSIAIYSNAINYPTMLALLFLGGVFAGANTLCFAMAYNLVPKEFAGTSGGFTNAIVMSSGIIFQPLLGKLLDLFRNGLQNADGSPLYTIDMYRSAFLFVIFGMILAIIATLFIDDMKHQEAE